MATLTAAQRSRRLAVSSKNGSGSPTKAGSSNVHTPATEEGVKRVWKLIKENNVQIIDLKFNDLPGLWQHFSIPLSELGDDHRKGIWADGIGFDGSSIRGFQKIQESDMNLYLDS